jgi:hypothetical protein
MPQLGYGPPETGDEPTRRVKFWITSNRGTDQEEIIRIPKSWAPSTIQTELEQWCEQFGAWHHGDNVVRYGYDIVRGRPPKTEVTGVKK